MNVGLNKTEKKVVSFLIEDSGYTSDELAAKIGVTKRTIERAFISLQRKKLLKELVQSAMEVGLSLNNYISKNNF